jgi:hypothetical protein
MQSALRALNIIASPALTLHWRQHSKDSRLRDKTPERSSAVPLPAFWCWQ